MANRLHSWPIRTHLTVLIALLAIPAISLIVYSGIVERNGAIEDATQECLKFVNSVAGQQQAIVAGAQQLVTALSSLPQIQSRNPSAVTTILSDLLKENPQYASISVTDKSGVVWASAIPFDGKVSLADRRYFQEAVRTGVFSSGEYLIGRMLKKPVISFGYPVKNASGELIAVMVVVLDLNYCQELFEKLNLPPGASFSLLDHRGVILIRNLNDRFSEKLVGRRDVSEELFAKMTEGPGEGTYEATGNDGNLRLVAYRRVSLPHESKPYIYVRTSIPLTSATSKANAAMFRNLSAFVALFLIVLFLAWFTGKRVIVNPLTVLKRASDHLAAGQNTVNVSHAVKGGELGELALAFDAMAATLVQRETALRESEQRWATTLSSIGDAVIATDIKGKVVFMNAAAEGLTGWTLHEASMKPVTEVFSIINEHTREEVESPVTRVLKEGTVVGLANHTILVKKDGTELPVDDSGAPIRDRHGNTAGVVLVFRDIIERRRAEADKERLLAELAAERARWQAAVENLLDPVTVCDAEGRATYMNRAYQQLIERPIAGDLVMEAHPDYYQLYRPDGTPFPAEDLPLQKAARTGEDVRDVELIQRSASGREFTAIFSAAPLRDGDGHVTGAVAVGRDITERKRMDEELRKSRDELELRVQERTEELSTAYERLRQETEERERIQDQLRQAQKMEALGTLTGGVAHDFNNILAAMIGFAELTRERLKEGSRERRHLDRVFEAGLRGRELIKQMMIFSRKKPHEKKPLRLSAVIKETMKILRPSIPATIDIKINIKRESGMILADPVHIQQVLMNLATNGAYAMRLNGGTLDLELDDFSVPRNAADPHGIKPGLYMRLRVKDSGEGMTKDVLAKIYDPFFTTKEPGEGTGLGLSVVHGIVKECDGYIVAESEVGDGTTFSLCFPKVAGQDRDEGIAAEAIPTGYERILLIDDEEALVEMGQEILTDLGYTVEAKRSSREGLALLRLDPSRFDLVITDQTMPEMTGVELVKEIFSIRADMPIIMCTGFSHLVDVDDAKAAGIKAFAMKPLTKREIAKTVREVLDG
jgi:two-component system, cell cycle sensor histidine kinase and response regulator CckA